MVKHIILTDATLDAADVIVITKGTLPQTIGSLAAGSYTVRNTSAPVAGEVSAVASGNWWTEGANIDLDYGNDRAYVAGTAYATIAAARAAGAIIVNANGNDTIAVSGLGTTYTLAGRGTTAATIGTEYIAAMGNSTNTNLVYIGTTSSGASKAGGWLTDGTSRLAQTTSTIPAASTFRAAVRVKSGAGLLSFNGVAGTSTTTTSLPGGINTLVIANRSTGARAWTGTVNRVVLLNGDLTDTQVHALLA
ncbi:MAG TPA: hypothetical protein VGC40_12880 [Paenirhodobacter sp.]